MELLQASQLDKKSDEMHTKELSSTKEKPSIRSIPESRILSINDPLCAIKDLTS